MRTIARTAFVSAVPGLVALLLADAKAAVDTSAFVGFGLSGHFTSTNGGFQESCFGRGVDQSGTFLFGTLLSGTPSASTPCGGGASNASGEAKAWAASNNVGSWASLSAGPRSGYSGVDARVAAGSTIQGQVRFAKTDDSSATGFVELLGDVKLTGSTYVFGPPSSLPYLVGQISATLSVTYTIDSYTETDYKTDTYDSQHGNLSSADSNSPLFELGVTNPTTVRLGVWIPFRITVASEVVASGVSQAASGYFVGGGADFFDTAALPVGRPVFRLPDGYTAESPGFGIVDNRIPAVPDVPTAWLAVLGLCLLRLTGLRRKDPRLNRTERPAFPGAPLHSMTYRVVGSAVRS